MRWVFEKPWSRIENSAFDRVTLVSQSEEDEKTIQLLKDLTDKELTSVTIFDKDKVKSPLDCLGENMSWSGFDNCLEQQEQFKKPLQSLESFYYDPYGSNVQTVEQSLVRSSEVP